MAKLFIALDGAACPHADGTPDICIRVFDSGPQQVFFEEVVDGETVTRDRMELGTPRTDLVPTLSSDTAEVASMVYEAAKGCFCAPATFVITPGQTFTVQVEEAGKPWRTNSASFQYRYFAE